MRNSLGNHVGITLLQPHDPLIAIVTAYCDVELPSENEKELVSVIVRMPHVLALDMRDTDVVVIYLRNDVRAPECME